MKNLNSYEYEYLSEAFKELDRELYYDLCAIKNHDLCGDNSSADMDVVERFLEIKGELLRDKHRELNDH